MTNDIMTQKRTTISLSENDKKQLETIARDEHRPVSNQIVHMMEFYLKYKDKVK